MSESFFVFRLQEKHNLLLTPYEKNLDVWRQLWRVIERRLVANPVESNMFKFKNSYTVLFKVSNTIAATVSLFWCLHHQLRANFICCSSSFIAEFEKSFLP